jgi:signal transduction histidine kinase
MRTFRARFLFALALIGILPLGAVGLGIALLDSRAITEQSTRELTGLARGLAGQLLITAVIRDITERKKANEELRKKTVELERSNKVKDEFLSIMSHELRTPLTAVMGYTSMMQDKMLGEISEEQEKTLGRVLKQSDDLLTLINSVMQASALEANAVNVESQVVNLGSFLNDLRLAYNVPLHKDLSLL